MIVPIVSLMMASVCLTGSVCCLVFQIRNLERTRRRNREMREALIGLVARRSTNDVRLRRHDAMSQSRSDSVRLS